jgi:cAMP phosphodiesterase
LGCSGNIGDNHNTTPFLIDDDILTDVCSGLRTLPMEALSKIARVLISHSHMDHIALLPKFTDATLSLRNKPIVEHGAKLTLAALSDHVFNWKILPDFRKSVRGIRPQ